MGFIGKASEGWCWEPTFDLHYSEPVVKSFLLTLISHLVTLELDMACV